MTTTIPNGRPPRKQLSDQLDRLDGIIDVMAEGLNKAVADAAREGSRAAVKEILTELLTNPDILAMIRATVGTAAPPAPAPAAREGGPVRSARGTVAALAGRTVRAVSSRLAAARALVRETGRALGRHPHLRKIVALGLGAGAVATVVAASNHTLASALSGLGAAGTAVALQVGGWLRRLRHRFE